MNNAHEQDFGKILNLHLQQMSREILLGFPPGEPFQG